MQSPYPCEIWSPPEDDITKRVSLFIAQEDKNTAAGKYVL